MNILFAHQLKVLIVEDSVPDAEMLVAEIQREGYQVSFKRVDTAGALEAALQSRDWDIIFADYMMPQFNAFEALSIFNASGLDIPFILVSGTVGEETAVLAMKAGAHDFLVKGKLARLVPVVERELGEARHRREKRQASAELPEAENARLALVVNSSDEAIFSMTTDDLIDTWNLAAERLFGYSATEIKGRPLSALIPESQRREFEEIRKKVQDGVSLLRHEHEIQTKDGRTIHVALTLSPMKDTTGQVIGAAGVAYGIRERIQLANPGG